MRRLGCEDVMCAMPKSSMTPLLLVIACTIPVASGCGSKLGATASGVVTLDGEPLSTGRVIFSRRGSAQAAAVGAVSESGRFSVVTGKTPGLPPGDYSVAIQAFKPLDIGPGERSMAKPEPLVPRRYLRPDTSGVEVTIDPGSNQVDIELTSSEG